MKVESHSAQSHMPPAPAPQETRQSHGPSRTEKNTSTSPSVVVDISAEAEETAGNPTGPGKSAMSTAHRARAMMAEYQALGATMSDVPFGQIVSRIARGMDASEFFSLPEPEPDGDVVDGPTGEAGDAIDAGTGDTLAEAPADGVGTTSDDGVGDAVAAATGTVVDGPEAIAVDDSGDGSDTANVTDAIIEGADEGASALASTMDTPETMPVDAETSLAEALLAATAENIAAEPEASLIETLLASEDETDQG